MNIFENAMDAFEFTDDIAEKIAMDWREAGGDNEKLYYWINNGFVDSLTKAVQRKVGALEMVAKAIDRETWTPVTESLPDTDGEYLVTTINDCGTRRIQVSSFVWFPGENKYSWGIETGPVYKVLAWMELPEIWEG